MDNCLSVLNANILFQGAQNWPMKRRNLGVISYDAAKKLSTEFSMEFDEIPIDEQTPCDVIHCNVDTILFYRTYVIPCAEIPTTLRRAISWHRVVLLRDFIRNRE